MNIKSKIAGAVAVGGVVGSSAASAAGIDFTAMTSSVDTTTVVTALVAMGAIFMAPGFAKWAVKKVGTFFG